MPVDVLYVLSFGFPVRTVLQSQVVPELQKRGLTVGVVVPHGGRKGVEAGAARHGIPVWEAPQFPNRLSTDGELRRRYLTEDVRKNPALYANHLRAARNPKARRAFVRSHYLYALNRLAMAFPAIRKGFEQRQQVNYQDEQFAKLLREIDPKLVVVTYPVDHLEGVALTEARRAGIRSVTQLLSWDNITSKGKFPAVSDRFISWGPIMSSEIEEFYNVPSEHIRECGVAHFDHHAHAKDAGRNAETLKEAGLDPNKPYLFFGMSAPRLFPREIDIVEWTAKKVEEGYFGPDMQLLVRPHPQNVTGNMADLSWLPRLDALKSSRVTIDYPRLGDASLNWNMDESDLPRMANLIAHCAVCINSGSTISIDALLNDRPVVLTCFDGEATLPWHLSARRYPELPHMAKLIAGGGTPYASNYREYGELVREAVEHPEKRADGRYRSISSEITVRDGSSAQKIAQAVLDFATEPK